MLRLAPALTLALFLAPIAAGLAGTLLPAFGYFPAIGGDHLSLAPWRALLAYPGFAGALRLTVSTGVLATILSLVLAVALSALLHGRPLFRRIEQAMTPLLAAPHAAVAIGFAFLMAPSGWLFRLASPWLTGWQIPPPITTIHDPLGLAMVAGLTLKEAPYLVLMIAGAAGQAPLGPALAGACAMGYRRPVAWLKVALPQIYPQIRLPVYAVLAFSLSVVETGIVLGPDEPPPLGVLAARWFADYDIARYFPAAAAATLQLAIVALAVLFWRAGEIAAAKLGRRWIARGGRGGPAGPATVAAAAIALLAALLGLLSLAAVALWSVADSWRFPAALPERWAPGNWARHTAEILPPATATLVIGGAAAAVAVILALACLEHEDRSRRRPGKRILLLLYLPLLVPQIAFLFGVETILVRLRLDGTWLAVIWAHLLFVLPYVFLSLADPWRRLDGRYARSAAGLGAAPARIFFRIKLPLLLRPILIAAAVGFAVSVGQYLPTVFAGAGRIATLTSDAVTLSSGGDRRIVGIYAILQAVLPLLCYSLALLVPALAYRRRRGMA